MNPGPGTLLSKNFAIISPILSLVSQKKCFLKPFFKSALMNPLPRKELFGFIDDAALVSKETWLQYLHPDNKINNMNRLKSLTVPTLIIIGEKDKSVPIEFQEDIADTIHKAVKVVMKNEGHAVVIEKPKKVLAEINSFLKRSC